MALQSKSMERTLVLILLYTFNFRREPQHHNDESLVAQLYLENFLDAVCPENRHNLIWQFSFPVRNFPHRLLTLCPLMVTIIWLDLHRASSSCADICCAGGEHVGN